MTPERWQQIEALFHAASARAPGERAAFLDAACGGDELLRQEVESLLTADNEQSVAEALPSMVAAAWMAQDRRRLAGQTMGRYRVIAPLGTGGMGEVYLAEDTSLNRQVALKFLPHQFTEDRERVRRFEQEARAASALNHPNILTIYEIGQFDDVQFIATEFVDGKTLRQWMTEASDLHEAIEVGIQIAGALAAAHNAGIVHRDIKPANIMVRSDGLVKVLDFGLAKLSTPSNEEVTSAVLTADGKTEPGRVMGTVHYMSPEQALGEPLDHRTDIFSLGVVLYEMFTGARPFRGESDAAFYNALLNRMPPSITNSDPGLPVELERIINKALEKKVADRYQSVSDLRSELISLQRDTDAGLSTSKTQSARLTTTQWSRWTTRAILATSVFTLLIAGWYVWRLEKSATPTAISHANFTPLTDQPGQELFPSLSPDGNSFVYASQTSGKWDIYLQRVGGKNAINLTKDSGADDTEPAFSPDGERIAFRSGREGGGIFIMGATGESPRRLTDFGYYPAWSADGKEIACSLDNFVDPNNRTIIPSQLWVVSVDTGEKRLVTKEDAAQPSWSPHGKRIAYWGLHQGGQRDIWTIPAGGGPPQAVTDDPSVDWNPVWSPAGNYLYFASDRGGSMNLWRVPIDELSGKTQGPPEPVTTPSVYSGNISFSLSGQRLAYVQTSTRNNLQQVSFDPEREKIVGAAASVTQGSKLSTNPDLSPDGEWFVFDAIGDKQEDLFVVRRDGTGMRQLTNDAYKDRGPLWSPDGKKIVFFSDRSGKYDTWVINPDGSGLQQVTYTSYPGTQISLWSPDGSQLVCNMQTGAPIVLDYSKTWQQQTPKSLWLDGDSNQWFMAFSWSKDGQKLAGALRPAGDYTNNIVSYSLASQQFERLLNFGERPIWLNDSRRLLFFQQDKTYLLDSASKKFHEVLSVAPNKLQAVGISNDNRLIYYSVTVTESDIWLMTLN